MLKKLLLALVILAAPAVCLADPSGQWDVVGTNPDNGQQYSGAVRVQRTGETYSVTWNIGGTEYVGTGLGAKFIGDRFEMGPASPEDTAISVGYVSGGTFGMAMYFLQADGSWQGVWTYGGSRTAAQENWYPQ